MKRVRSFGLALLLPLCVALISACSIVGQEVVEPPEEPEYVFYYDFADAEIGTMPAGWTVGNTEMAGIVAAPELPAGKALRGMSDGSGNADTHVRTQGTWGSAMAGARTIGVEYKFKVVKGHAVNFNLSSSKGHHVNLYLQNDGSFRYRTESLHSTGATWEQGTWHHVRIIADRVAEEFTLYFDNMSAPLGTYPFRVTPLESWGNVHWLALHSKGTESEVWYSDVKIWIVE